MNHRFFYFLFLSLSISACSSINKKHASGGFEYAEKHESKPLAFPQNLDKPDEHKKFMVSNEINQTGPVGKDMDIRAPSLVLPLAASSRVIAESDEAIIWFDKVLEDRDLLSFLEQSVISELTSANVGYTLIKSQEKSPDNQISRISIYESEWFEKEVESGWLFTEIESVTSLRFRYELAIKAHGRSAYLKVSLIDYMRKDQEGDSKHIGSIDKHRAEIAMLNEMVSQVDYDYRTLQHENRLTRANQQIVTMGMNDQDESALIVEMSLDNLWDNMPIFFEKYGFTISDLNESKKVYYVNYVKPESSLWDSIWGDEAPVIEIEEAEYQFSLKEIGDKNEKTVVTIFNAKEEALSLETVQRIFPVIKVGLSF